MSTRLHIVSLGTSIISNLRNRKGLEIPFPPEDWLKDKREDRDFCEAAYKALAEDPYKMSAELNGMRDFLERGEVDEVYLIATDTEAGRFCSEVLKRYLSERGVRVLGESGPILGYYKVRRVEGEEEAAEVFSEHLSILFNHLVGFLRKHREELGKEVYINATGGFKPELAVLSLVGNLFLVPVYYRHETFGVSVFLPPLIPPELFPDELTLLKRLSDAAGQKGYLRGPKAEELVREAPEVIQKLESFRVIEVEREPSGRVYGLKLTPQGKFWINLHK